MTTTTGSAARCWTRKAVKGGSELSFDIHRSVPWVFTVFSAYMRELIRAQVPLVARRSLLPGHEPLLLLALTDWLSFHLPPVLRLLPLQLRVHLDQRYRVNHGTWLHEDTRNTSAPARTPPRWPVLRDGLGLTTGLG
jgi:hypothetical protein